jgi:hypothetical protein
VVPVWQAFLEYRDDILNYLGIRSVSLTKTKQRGYVLVRAVQSCSTASNGVSVLRFPALAVSRKGDAS